MEKYLSWFLGPKSENSIVFEDLIKLIVKDYLHWRKNYFPQEELLLSPADTRGFINEQVRRNTDRKKSYGRILR